MRQLDIILSLIATIIGLSITLLTFFVKTIRNARAKRIAEQAIKIGNAILPFIREAEKFAGYSGTEKKTFVMTRVNQFTIDNHISFDEKQVSDKIEELVTLTKQINAEGRNKKSWP
jgi:hypothetical protein